MKPRTCHIMHVKAYFYNKLKYVGIQMFSSYLLIILKMYIPILMLFGEILTYMVCAVQATIERSFILCIELIFIESLG